MRKLWCALWGHGPLFWEPRLRPGPATPPFDTHDYRRLLLDDKDETFALLFDMRGIVWGGFTPAEWSRASAPWGSMFCLLSRWSVIVCARCRGELEDVDEASMPRVVGEVRRPYSDSAGWVTLGPLRRVWEYLQCQLVGHRTEWQRDAHLRAWQQYCETCGQEFGKPITDRGLRTVLSDLCQWFRAPAKWWLEPEPLDLQYFDRYDPLTGRRVRFVRFDPPVLSARRIPCVSLTIRQPGLKPERVEIALP